MKYLLCTLLFIGTLFSSQAQSSVANEKLNEAFSSAEVSSMTPEKIDYYNFFSSKVYRVFDNAKEDSSLEDISVIKNKKTGASLSVSALEDGEFNPLLFNLNQDTSSPHYYLIGETGKVLMIQSMDRLDLMYSRYKANQH